MMPRQMNTRPNISPAPAARADQTAGDPPNAATAPRTTSASAPRPLISDAEHADRPEWDLRIRRDPGHCDVDRVQGHGIGLTTEARRALVLDRDRTKSHPRKERTQQPPPLRHRIHGLVDLAVGEPEERGVARGMMFPDIFPAIQ